MKKQITTLWLTAVTMAGAAAAPASDDSALYWGVDAVQVNASSLTDLSSDNKTAKIASPGTSRLFSGYQFDNNVGVEIGYSQARDGRQGALIGTSGHDDGRRFQGIDVAGVYKFQDVPGLSVRASASYGHSRVPN